MESIGHYWFDVLIAIVVISGLVYGYKQGISVELVPMLKWITIVVVCGTFYKELGSELARSVQIQPNLAFVVVYLVMAGILMGIATAIKNAIGEKLVGAHVFGKAELPLGAIAGIIHFGCVIFVGLSLLSSAYVTEEELTGPPLPAESSLADHFSPANIQRGVFHQARSGQLLKGYLGQWLIAAQPPVQYETKKIEGFGRKMEKAVEEDLAAGAK